MNLLDFLCKWSKGNSAEESKLKAMLCGLFERDPRTLQNWVNQTPKYVRPVLRIIDREWETNGISYSIFFDF